MPAKRRKVGVRRKLRKLKPIWARFGKAERLPLMRSLGLGLQLVSLHLLSVCNCGTERVSASELPVIRDLTFTWAFYTIFHKRQMVVGQE